MALAQFCFILFCISFGWDFALCQKKTVADDFRECYLKDKTQVNTCMLQTWKQLVPLMKTGIPELNVPQMDPLTLDTVNWDEKSPAIKLTSTLTNMKIYGGSNSVVTAATINPVARTTSVNLAMPSVFISGDYVMNGTVILLPINGKGQLQLNVTDMILSGVGHIQQQGIGVRMSKLTVDLTVKSMAIKFVNAGTDPVWDAIASLVNENSKLLFDDMKPAVARKLSETIMKLAEGVLLKMPAEAFIA